MAEDYYKVLGVRRDASQADIQKAYRDLARKYHPDLHPDDKDAKRKFQQVQTAFDVLNDPEKREMYDRYGSSFENMGARGPRGGPAWDGGQGAGGPHTFQFDDGGFAQFFGDRFSEMPGDLGDIFSQFRRSSGGRTRGARPATPRHGADVTSEVQIPFATSIMGGEVQLTVQRSGGRVDTITVKIPVGIEDGKKIRLRGQGEPSPAGGTAGDILLTVRVAPHPFFHRQGDHLLLRVPVTLAEAAAGAKVDVPTPSGTVSLRIPAGTSSGAKLRIKGHGVRKKDGTAGDLLAELQIVLPKDLSEPDLQALREIDHRHPLNPRAELRW